MTIRFHFPHLALLLTIVVGFVWPSHPAAAETLSAGDKAVYRAAFKAVEKDKWSDARRIAGQAKNKLPAKVIQWLDLTRPGLGRSFDEISQFMRENPGWPYQNTLQAMGERNMPSSLSAQATIAWFQGREPQTAYGAAELAITSYLESAKTLEDPVQPTDPSN